MIFVTIVKVGNRLLNAYKMELCHRNVFPPRLIFFEKNQKLFKFEKVGDFDVKTLFRNTTRTSFSKKSSTKLDW